MEDPLKLAANLRRILDSRGMTVAELSRASDLTTSTIDGALVGAHKVHGKTVDKLVKALGIERGELFVDNIVLPDEIVDATQLDIPQHIQRWITEDAATFVGWTRRDFAMLMNKLGARPTVWEFREMALTVQGYRRTLAKVRTIIQTGEADLFCEMVEVFYRRAVGP
ncbi:MAG: helix-turn-helix transcriptional regulator [Pirellulales bacterium]